jgi:hypothetical protein
MTLFCTLRYPNRPSSSAAMTHPITQVYTWNQQQNKLALLLLLLLQPLVSVPPSSLQCTLSHTVAVRRTARMQCISDSTYDDAPPSNVHLRVIHAITSAKLKVRRTSRMATTHDSSREGSRERGEFHPKKKQQKRTSDTTFSTSAPPSVRRSSRQLHNDSSSSRLPVQADDSSSESSSDDDSPLVPLVLLSQGSTFVACDTNSARICLKAMFEGSHVHGHVVCNNSR